MRMKTRITQLAGGAAAAAVLAPAAHASLILNGANQSKTNSNPTNLFGGGGVFETVANTLIFIVGAVAVIMLIIGGLRYVASQGNEKNVTAAKDTILYSVIGIVVAILAYAVVAFVAKSFT